MELKNALDNMKGKKVLVIGDIMLDKSIWGHVERVSPEAPVQIVEAQKETFAPGGAANTASNIASLGGSVFLVGLVGNDDSRDLLLEELKKRFIYTGGIISDDVRPTIQKIRIMGKNQQLLRIDYENRQYCEGKTCDKIKEYINKVLPEIDAVVISDYAKGLITKDLSNFIINECNKAGKKIIVDPKPKHLDFYDNVTLITPNHVEASSMTNIEESADDDVEKMGKKLVEMTNSGILITRGEKGMSLFEKSGAIHHIPTKAKDVYDVTGAGDTVVATLAVALAADASHEEAANIANHAAGLVVGKVGTASVTIDELKTDIDNEQQKN